MIIDRFDKDGKSGYISNVVVWALKKFFKTEKRKEKQFYFWGKKKTYEYIVFW